MFKKASNFLGLWASHTHAYTCVCCIYISVYVLDMRVYCQSVCAQTCTNTLFLHARFFISLHAYRNDRIVLQLAITVVNQQTLFQVFMLFCYLIFMSLCSFATSYFCLYALLLPHIFVFLLPATSILCLFAPLQPHFYVFLLIDNLNFYVLCSSVPILTWFFAHRNDMKYFELVTTIVNQQPPLPGAAHSPEFNAFIDSCTKKQEAARGGAYIYE